jgi:hypothetical protein
VVLELYNLAVGSPIVHILSGGEVRWAVRMGITRLGIDTTRRASLKGVKNLIYPLKTPRCCMGCRPRILIMVYSEVISRGL